MEQLVIRFFLIIAYGGLFLWELKNVENDKDYNFRLSNKERVKWYSLIALSSLFLIKMNIFAAAFSIIALMYMHISAITDSKTKLVSMKWVIIILPLAVICESIQANKFSCYTLFILALSVLLYTVGGYGAGDITLSFIPPVIFYLDMPVKNITTAVMVWLFILIITVVSTIIKAVFQKNLKTGLKLKESEPLGPHILFASYLYIGCRLVFSFL